MIPRERYDTILRVFIIDCEIMPKGKTIRSDARRIVSNVLQYCRKEKEQGRVKVPVTQVMERVRQMTGVGEKAVRNIKKITDSGGELTTPKRKKVATPHNKAVIDDFDKSIIRRVVHDFYHIKKTVPGLADILEDVRKEMHYPWGRRTLSRHLRELGFTYGRTKNRRKVLIETPSIVLKRTEYLRKRRNLRQQNDTRPVIFMDETWIGSGETLSRCWQSPTELGPLPPCGPGLRIIIVHAGGKNGFVEGAELVYDGKKKTGDYHDEMNSGNYSKWFEEKLLSNLNEPHVIIIDNAPYHSTQVDKAPTTNDNKNVMQEWLRAHNIHFSPDDRKCELMEKIKANKPPIRYKIDELAASKGHEVIRLPPWHPDLNPIEYIWGDVKRKVRQRNLDFKATTTMQLVREELGKVDAAMWQKKIEHVEKLEKNYWDVDGIMEDMEVAQINEPIIVNTNSDSSDDSEDDVCWGSDDGDDVTFNDIHSDEDMVSLPSAFRNEAHSSRTLNFDEL